MSFATLHQLLVERFSEGELQTLCLHLQVDYESLPGAGKADKARELVVYLDRRRALLELVTAGKQLRPDIRWEELEAITNNGQTAASGNPVQQQVAQLPAKVRDNKQHPVWDVYDEYRTARFRKKCYAAELQKLKRINFALEAAIAVFTPTSAIAILFLGTTGQSIWEVCLAIAATLAVIKPLTGLTAKIIHLEGRLAKYEMLEHDLHVIRLQVSQQQAYTDGMRKRFLEILEAQREMNRNVADVHFSQAQRRRFQAEVNGELPSSTFYVPED